MFRSARLKLTAWYVAIIMLISILFSMVIFAGIYAELTRYEYIQRLRIERQQEEHPLPFPKKPPSFDPEVMIETIGRLTFVLIGVNIGILIISAGASYFLAGRTLKPIKEMVDEQNRFITDASHELRTPLTSLRSELEVNLRDKNLTIQDAKILLKSNLEEVINLQSLSDGLMQLSQYQKKNGHFSLEQISLTEIIGNAEKKIAPQAYKKKINLKNKSDDYVLEGNKQSLTELFIILLDNAVKYSPKKSSIYISSDKNDHTLIIKIKDEGIGIDQKDLPHIFDRFYRADKSRSKEGTTGYGLGLSIAQKIVKLHNGNISAESVLRKGTEFTIQLPQRQNSNII